MPVESCQAKYQIKEPVLGIATAMRPFGLR